jgi:ADP-ribosyl-[dinitrogen reductase] hydrolase
VASTGAPRLSTAQTDRAAGVLLAQACGDALGRTVPGRPAPGGYGAGTRMAVRLTQLAAAGTDLAGTGALDEITGIAGRLRPRTQDGALLGTAPLALAYRHEPEVMAAAVRAVLRPAHAADPLTAEAAVLWCAGIAGAVTHGSLDGLRGGLDLLPASSRDRWARQLAEAEQSPATGSGSSGSAVSALPGAYAAVCATPVPPDEPAEGSFPCLQLPHALAATAGTPAAGLAGALLGARWGASAVPFGWRRSVSGRPGQRSRDLVRLGVLAAGRGAPDPQGWPQCARMPYDVVPRPAVPHPCDDGVLLGNVAAISDADAVVSLCRRGRQEVPAPGVAAADHIEVRLFDRADPAENPNLEFTIDDAARAVATLRAEGRRVLLHCVHGQSRTPTVAARYAVLCGLPVAEALAAIAAAVPGARTNPTLRRALGRLGEPTRPSA